MVGDLNLALDIWFSFACGVRIVRDEMCAVFLGGSDLCSLH